MGCVCPSCATWTAAASPLGISSHYPLGKVTTTHLKRLCEVLWSWSICQGCLIDHPCTTAECPWQRFNVLGRFFRHYKILTSAYHCHLGLSPALPSHADLLRTIQKLKEHPDLSKEDLLERLFADRPIRIDQDRALNLAARAMFMMNCSSSRHSSILFEHRTHHTPWKKDVTFAQFITDSFPQNEHPEIEEIKLNLRATRLKKHAGLRFQQTDDLRNHLRLDRKAATVDIFHHTAFLKEQLRITRDVTTELSVADALKLGVLPRQLALEVSDSIQKILFPLEDAKSKKLLLSLTSSNTCNFDTDVLRFDFVSIRRVDEQVLPYVYLGSRLGDLYEEQEDPMPREGFQKWFQRNSSARSIMMATVAGVIFAIFLGLLSLAVGVFQVYVGYMAWKHPVKDEP